MKTGQRVLEKSSGRWRVVFFSNHLFLILVSSPFVCVSTPPCASLSPTLHTAISITWLLAHASARPPKPSLPSISQTHTIRPTRNLSPSTTRPSTSSRTHPHRGPNKHEALQQAHADLVAARSPVHDAGRGGTGRAAGAPGAPAGGSRVCARAVECGPRAAAARGGATSGRTAGEWFTRERKRRDGG